jgi:hypothetical protein
MQRHVVMPTETDLREAATQRVRATSGLIIHVTMYIAINIGLYVLWLATGGGYPWFAWPLLAWGMGLVGHGIAYAIGPGSAGEEALIERRMRRLRMQH